MESKNHDYDHRQDPAETPAAPETAATLKEAHERLLGATATLLELEADLSEGIKYYDLRVSGSDWLCFVQVEQETARLIEIRQFILGPGGEKTQESIQAIIDLGSHLITDASGAVLDSARATDLAVKTEKLL